MAGGKSGNKKKGPGKPLLDEEEGGAYVETDPNNLINEARVERSAAGAEEDGFIAGGSSFKRNLDIIAENKLFRKKQAEKTNECIKNREDKLDIQNREVKLDITPDHDIHLIGHDDIPFTTWSNMWQIVTFPVYVILYALFFVILTIPIFVIGQVAVLFMVIYYAIVVFLENHGVVARKFPRMEEKKIDKSNYVWTVLPDNFPTELHLDFWMWRIPGYITTVALSFPEAYATRLTCRARVTIIGDDTLKRFLSSSFVVHNYSRRISKKRPTEKSEWYYLELGALTTSKEWFPGVKYSCTGAKCEKDGTPKAIYIKGSTGNALTVRPGDQDWLLAKTHFVTSALTAGATIFHSWVHFVLPDASACSFYNNVPRDGVLYQLLYPHLRFTLRINQVLNDGTAIDKTRGGISDKFFPFMPVETTAEGFVKMNSAFTNRFYFAADEILPPYVKDAFKIFINTGRFPERVDRLDDWDPPNYAQTTFTNYHRFLASYYIVIRVFIGKVMPFIDQQHYDLWMKEIGVILPAVLEVDPADMISCIIWHTCITHNTDHLNDLSFRRYACNTLYVDYDYKKYGTVETIQKMFQQWDIVVAQGTYDVFINPFHHPFFNHRLQDVVHKFDIPRLQQASAEFRKDLRANEAHLKEIGLDLVDLRDFTASLCY